MVAHLSLAEDNTWMSALPDMLQMHGCACRKDLVMPKPELFTSSERLYF